MGNKLGRRRQVVDDKYTRPQGLYQHRDVDHKKLRKLILDSKLAPCFPGDDDCTLVDLEECPICFLYYPSLNRSRCCTKGICTECFLQMKPPHSARPTQCPFCKTSNYAVEYRGMRTKEEKGKEQIEEQRVIEAKIRMQQREHHDEEEKMQKRQAVYSSSKVVVPGEVEYQDLSTSSVAVTADKHVMQDDKFLSSQSSFILPTSRRLPNLMYNWEGELDLDLEEIMVKEAIWLSIQENDTYFRNPAIGGNVSSVSSSTADNYNSHAVIPVGTSSSNRLVFPAAEMADSLHVRGNSANSFGMLPNLSCLAIGNERLIQDYHHENWIDVSPGCGRATSREDGELATAHGSEVEEAGTSYASSDVTLDSGTGLAFPEAVSIASGHLLPETFEEQMMLAMAVSLADARAMRNAPGTTWL